MFEQVKVLGATIRLAMGQLSVLPLSTSAPVMEAMPNPSRLIVMFVQLATGNSLSVIATLKRQVLVPPSPSTTMATTGFVPTGKVEPLAGVELTFVTVQPFTAGNTQVTLLLLHWPG